MDWRRMDRATLDRAYDNMGAVADSGAWLARWREASGARRAMPGAVLDQAYGAREQNRIDLFPSGAADASPLVFFHGGYWQRNAKEGFACMADGPLARGIDVALAGYTLCPGATMTEVVAEARAAVAWIAAHARALGFPMRQKFAPCAAGTVAPAQCVLPPKRQIVEAAPHAMRHVVPAVADDHCDPSAKASARFREPLLPPDRREAQSGNGDEPFRNGCRFDQACVGKCRCRYCGSVLAGGADAPKAWGVVRHVLFERVEDRADQGSGRRAERAVEVHGGTGRVGGARVFRHESSPAPNRSRSRLRARACLAGSSGAGRNGWCRRASPATACRRCSPPLSGDSRRSRGKVVARPLVGQGGAGGPHSRDIDLEEIAADFHSGDEARVLAMGVPPGHDVACRGASCPARSCNTSGTAVNRCFLSSNTGIERRDQQS